MIYNIELYSRFEAAFGFAAANMMAKGETALVKSSMNVFTTGDRTFANMKLQSKDGKVYDFTTPGDINGLAGVMAPPPMISFSREKNISRTVIDNSDYEVIENFGKKQWCIQMEGLLVDMANHWYPSELLQQTREIFDIDDILSVTGQIFNDLKIQSIYFDRLDDISFVEGFNDTLRYRLIAFSTNPTEFLLL